VDLDLIGMCGVAGTLQMHVVWLGPYRCMWCGWDLTGICGMTGNIQKCVVWLGPYRHVWYGWELTEVCPVVSFRVRDLICSIYAPDIRILYIKVCSLVK
jgi:hypothetical protein